MPLLDAIKIDFGGGHVVAGHHILPAILGQLPNCPPFQTVDDGDGGHMGRWKTGSWFAEDENRFSTSAGKRSRVWPNQRKDREIRTQGGFERSKSGQRFKTRIHSGFGGREECHGQVDGWREFAGLFVTVKNLTIAIRPVMAVRLTAGEDTYFFVPPRKGVYDLGGDEVPSRRIEEWRETKARWMSSRSPG